jgi:hypothetical protein
MNLIKLKIHIKAFNWIVVIVNYISKVSVFLCVTILCCSRYLTYQIYNFSNELVKIFFVQFFIICHSDTELVIAGGITSSDFTNAVEIYNVSTGRCSALSYEQ